MLRVAIVEDEQKVADEMASFFARYGAETDTEFQVTKFPNAVNFLSGYQAGFDIICMDIEMPHMNGMEAAKKLREIDSQVVLIFVTNLAQYAIDGYEVDAMSYMLKPTKYATFRFVIKKAMERCKKAEKSKIEIMENGTLLCLPVSAVYYVEINVHSILYHTNQGNYKGYGTMKKVEDAVPPGQFFRCNSCYLVNLEHVKKVDGNNVWVGSEVIQVSRPRKKSFLEALHEYYCQTQ